MASIIYLFGGSLNFYYEILERSTTLLFILPSRQVLCYFKAWITVPTQQHQKQDTPLLNDYRIAVRYLESTSE
ncbi:hypothetical protein WDW89_00590 [Deltaproteobacteria bacterium TL4]